MALFLVVAAAAAQVMSQSGHHVSDFMTNWCLLLGLCLGSGIWSHFEDDKCFCFEFIFDVSLEVMNDDIGLCVFIYIYIFEPL